MHLLEALKWKLEDLKTTIFDDKSVEWVQRDAAERLQMLCDQNKIMFSPFLNTDSRSGEKDYVWKRYNLIWTVSISATCLRFVIEKKHAGVFITYEKDLMSKRETSSAPLDIDVSPFAEYASDHCVTYMDEWRLLSLRLQETNRKISDANRRILDANRTSDEQVNAIMERFNMRMAKEESKSVTKREVSENAVLDSVEVKLQDIRYRNNAINRQIKELQRSLASSPINAEDRLETNKQKGKSEETWLCRITGDVITHPSATQNHLHLTTTVESGLHGAEERRQEGEPAPFFTGIEEIDRLHEIASDRKQAIALRIERLKTGDSLGLIEYRHRYETLCNDHERLKQCWSAAEPAFTSTMQQLLTKGFQLLVEKLDELDEPLVRIQEREAERLVLVIEQR